MAGKIELSENMENYLETILDLETENKVARGKDIADRLGVYVALERTSPDSSRLRVVKSGF